MIPITIKELDKIHKKCKTMVKKSSSASAVAAVVPVPGVDVTADIAIMRDLLPKISRKFGLSAEQIEELDPARKAQILVVITSLGSKVVGKYVTKEIITLMLRKISKRIVVKQVAKYVPFVGQAVSASISFAAMKYLGDTHVDECYAVCKQIIQSGEYKSA